MAPQNRIVTLDDILDNNSSSSSSNNNNNNKNNNVSATSGAGSGGYGYDDSYCKPVGEGDVAPLPVRGSVPLHVIPGLPKSDACLATLQRIHDEFFPIVQRRGFNLISISEMCCCGDGLDNHNKGRNRRMGNNVLGYNQTTFFRWQTSNKKRSKSHAIHLRLRNPSDHTQLFSWEDVAGTMAHELSHCVHNNHSKAFFAFVEEILEEHAVLQAQTFSRGSGLHDRETTPRAGDPAAFSAAGHRLGDRTGAPASSSTGGHRLGGKTTEQGKSRLLGGITGKPSDHRGLREFVAKAAESRRRQMQRLRRLIERSTEPCVIEIFDDDDDGDNDGSSINKHGGVRDNGNRKKRDEIIVISDSETTPYPGKRRTGKRTKCKQKETTIRWYPNEAGEESQPQQGVIDLTGGTAHRQVAVARAGSWSCLRCTYKNPATADRCGMCLGRR